MTIRVKEILIHQEPFQRALIAIMSMALSIDKSSFSDFKTLPRPDIRDIAGVINHLIYCLQEGYKPDHDTKIIDFIVDMNKCEEGPKKT